MRPKWLKEDLKLPESHSPELAIVYILQEVEVIAEVVEEVNVAAVEEVALLEPMSKEILFSMLRKSKVADSKASQETLILSTSNPVSAEALESQMRRRVAMAAATGAPSQTVPIREGNLMRVCQMRHLHQSSQQLRLRLRNQWKLRLRKKRKPIPLRKKLSSASVLMIS